MTKCLSVFALVAFACSARATIITITLTGTVSSGSDLTGVFLPGCTQNNPCDLKNQSFILAFTFDDTMGTPQPPGGASIQQTANSNPGTALLTINSKSFEFAAPGRLGPYTSMAQSDIPPGHEDEYSVAASDLGSSVGGHLYPVAGGFFGNGADWRTSFTYLGAFATGDALVANIDELSASPA